MKNYLLAAALVVATMTAIPAVSYAGQQCSWIGQYWVCNGTGTNTTTRSCSWIGQYWVCN